MPGKTSLGRAALVCALAALLVGTIMQCRVERDTVQPNRVRPAPVAPAPARRKAVKPKVKRIVFGKDVTKELRKMNSALYASPPRRFRPVRVTRRHFSRRRTKRTRGGFEVRFPSRAPITTPAVYKGRVYVSGGFRSKQFYAFSATTGKVEWGVNLGDDGPSAPACDEDVCVFNTESCTVFALHARTGKRLWSHWLGDPQMSAPTIANGRVFTSYPTRRRHGRKALPPGSSHVLAAFALKTGKLLWQQWIDGDVMSAPVAAGKEVFITTFAGTVVELDQATGKILSAFKARATSAPIVSGNDVFFTQRVDKKGAKVVEEGMVKRRRSVARPAPRRAVPTRPTSWNVRPRWKVGPVGAGPLLANLGAPRAAWRHAPRGRTWMVGGGKYRPWKKRARYLDRKFQRKTLYFKSGKSLDEANGFANTPSSAKARVAAGLVGQGTVSRLQSFQGSRVLHFNKRNFNTMGDELVCTDPESGAKLWSTKIKGSVKKIGGFLATPPAAAGKWLVLGLTQGQVIIVDPKSGKKSKTIQVGSPVRSQPIVHAGWIYVGTSNGRLVAINTKDKTLTGWTQWGGDAKRSASR